MISSPRSSRCSPTPGVLAGATSVVSRLCNLKLDVADEVHRVQAKDLVCYLFTHEPKHERPIFFAICFFLSAKSDIYFCGTRKHKYRP